MTRGKVAIVGGAALWGTAGTAGAFAPVQAGSTGLASARLIVGGVLLTIAAGPALRTALRSDRAALLGGAIAVAAYQLCYFAAVQYAGVTIGSVAALASGPIFAGLLMWVLDGARPSARWGAATAIAVVGCAALVLGSGHAAGAAPPLGVALGLLGGFFYAFYVVMAARVIGRGSSSNAVMGVLFGGAALIMVPVLLASGMDWLGSVNGVAVILYLGVVTTGLAYLLYGRGLRTTSAATATTLALAEPAVAALLGVFVLHETLPAVSWAGLVLLGASLLTVGPGRSA